MKKDKYLIVQRTNGMFAIKILVEGLLLSWYKYHKWGNGQLKEYTEEKHAHEEINYLVRVAQTKAALPKKTKVVAKRNEEVKEEYDTNYYD